MQANLQNTRLIPEAHYGFSALCSQEVPWPAFERGWLHGRLSIGPWDLPRLAEKMGENLWLSYYSLDDGEADTADLSRAKPRVFAGYAPSGGFIEVYPCRSNAVVDPPRSKLFMYAATPALALQLLEDLRKEYFITTPTPSTGPRIALLNVSYDSLEVHRVSITENQLVPREHADLYYGDGTADWIKDWTAQLLGRRYGLSILSGAPGTGKTTLLRSLSAWLGDTHLFYYMPAARFGNVDSGELVKFWTGENQTSKLRKILVLEDADGILLHRTTDNRDQSATLLNLTDGILGDALGLQIICTMNGLITDTDSALLRPGRLLTQREIKPLSGAALLRLATFLGKPIPENDAVTLAQIFNPARIEKVVPTSASRPKMGFWAATHRE